MGPRGRKPSHVETFSEMAGLVIGRRRRKNGCTGLDWEGGHGRRASVLMRFGDFWTPLMLWPQPPCSNLKVPLRCCGLSPSARIPVTPPILWPQPACAHPRDPSDFASPGALGASWGTPPTLRPQPACARSSDPCDLASRAALGAFQRPLRSCVPSGSGRIPATPPILRPQPACAHPSDPRVSCGPRGPAPLMQR